MPIDPDALARLRVWAAAHPDSPHAKTVILLLAEYDALAARYAAVVAEREVLRAENVRLEQLVCDFQAAAMIEVTNQGDPSGVEPRHVERHVTGLVNENDRLTAERDLLRAEAAAAADEAGRQGEVVERQRDLLRDALLVSPEGIVERRRVADRIEKALDGGL